MRAPPEKRNAALAGGGASEDDAGNSGKPRYKVTPPHAQASDILIGSIDKNDREQVRLQLRPWKGLDLVDLRIFAFSSVGEYKPTKEGVCLRVEKLPELLALVTKAEAEARRRGLLPRRAA